MDSLVRAEAGFRVRRSSDGGSRAGREDRAWTCLCGNALAPVLVDLASPWCHDCRDDQQRREVVLAELKRERGSLVSFRASRSDVTVAAEAPSASRRAA
jgi:hypothetical protein